MGVYIKGMKMPKGCAECEFCYWSNYQQENVCDKYDYRPVGDRFQYEKANFCPLVEVPEPHGRLIDADACIDYIRNDNQHAWEALAYAPIVIEGSSK